jgi:hypothetical protein
MFFGVAFGPIVGFIAVFWVTSSAIYSPDMGSGSGGILVWPDGIISRLNCSLAD